MYLVCVRNHETHSLNDVSLTLWLQVLRHNYFKVGQNLATTTTNKLPAPVRPPVISPQKPQLAPPAQHHAAPRDSPFRFDAHKQQEASHHHNAYSKPAATKHNVSHSNSRSRAYSKRCFKQQLGVCTCILKS